jgi:hypothetical protein
MHLGNRVHDDACRINQQKENHNGTENVCMVGMAGPHPYGNRHHGYCRTNRRACLGIRNEKTHGVVNMKNVIEIVEQDTLDEIFAYIEANFHSQLFDIIGYLCNTYTLTTTQAGKLIIMYTEKKDD